MNRLRLGTISLLLSVVVSARAEGPAADSLAQHVFYLGDERVVVLRFEVFIEGKPSAAAWQEFLDRRFKQLDANTDGALTGDELRSIPSKQLLIQLGISSSGADDNARPPNASATREGFLAYYRRAVEPFRVRIEQPGQPDARGVVRRQQPADQSPRVLFEKLDADNDGLIAAADFQNAQQVLRKLDLDRDESISTGELVQTTNLAPVALAAAAGNNQPPNPKFLSVQAGQPARQLVQQLLTARDGHGGAAKDNRLSFAELGLPAAKLQPFDADTDGALDFEETQQFLAAPPEDVRLIVRLGAARGQQPIEILSASGSPSEVGSSLTFGKVQMELNLSPAFGMDARNIVQQFKSMDQDNNGYLEGMEAQRFGINALLFGAVDADKDGKIFPEEHSQFYLPLMEMEQACVLLDIADGGHDLFRILDTNRDGRLGPREFQSAMARMPNWDVNHDGKLAQPEVPQQYRLGIGRGSLGTTGRVLAVASTARSSPGVRPQQAGGPAWFTKMDRNGDGDVSQREFLGPAYVFARLDKDFNGLLDANEAAAGN